MIDVLVSRLLARVKCLCATRHRLVWRPASHNNDSLLGEVLTAVGREVLLLNGTF